MIKIFKLFSLLIYLPILLEATEETTTDANSNTTTPKAEYYKSLTKAGFLAKSKKAKFIASIKRLDAETTYAEHHVCVGAIISPLSVVTAAECTYDHSRPFEPYELSVVVGTDHGSMDESSAQIIPVRLIRRHDSYDIRYEKHNLAILRLNDTIDFDGDTVATTTIATSPPNSYEICTSIGFGVLYYKETKLSQVLEGKFKIWPMHLCETYLRKHGKSEELGFCAGDLKDLRSMPCKIIASEPLYCNDVLYGVSIFNIGCESSKGFASVYIKIWEYEDWFTVHGEALRDGASLRDFSKFLLLLAMFCLILNFW